MTAPSANVTGPVDTSDGPFALEPEDISLNHGLLRGLDLTDVTGDDPGRCRPGGAVAIGGCAR